MKNSRNVGDGRAGLATADIGSTLLALRRVTHFSAGATTNPAPHQSCNIVHRSGLLCETWNSLAPSQHASPIAVGNPSTHHPPMPDPCAPPIRPLLLDDDFGFVRVLMACLLFPPAAPPTAQLLVWLGWIILFCRKHDAWVFVDGNSDGWKAREKDKLRPRRRDGRPSIHLRFFFFHWRFAFSLAGKRKQRETKSPRYAG